MKTRLNYGEIAPDALKGMLELEKMAIIAINGWNRLAISFRTEPGSYQPSQNE